MRVWPLANKFGISWLSQVAKCLRISTIAHQYRPLVELLKLVTSCVVLWVELAQQTWNDKKFYRKKKKKRRRKKQKEKRKEKRKNKGRWQKNYKKNEKREEKLKKRRTRKKEKEKNIKTQ